MVIVDAERSLWRAVYKISTNVTKRAYDKTIFRELELNWNLKLEKN